MIRLSDYSGLMLSMDIGLVCCHLVVVTVGRVVDCWAWCSPDLIRERPVRVMDAVLQRESDWFRSDILALGCPKFGQPRSCVQRRGSQSSVRQWVPEIRGSLVSFVVHGSAGCG